MKSHLKTANGALLLLLTAQSIGAFDDFGVVSEEQFRQLMEAGLFEAETSTAQRQCLICNQTKNTDQFVRLHCGHSTSCNDCLRTRFYTYMHGTEGTSIHNIMCGQPECQDSLWNVADVAAVTDNDPEAVALLNGLMSQARRMSTYGGMRADISEDELQMLIASGVFGEEVAAASSSQDPVHQQSADQSAQQESRDCPVCFEEVPVHDFPRLQCGHNTNCLACLRHVVQAAVQERTTKNLTCPQHDCEAALTMHDIALVTNNDAAIENQINNILLQELLATLPGLIQCPTADCQNSFTVDEGERVRVRCDACQQTYCSSCLHDHILDISCAEARENRQLEQDPNAAERAGEDWVRQNTQPCPGCRMGILKTEGCNHMTCSRCHSHFCWVCTQDWTNRQAPMGYIKSCECEIFG